MISPASAAFDLLLEHHYPPLLRYAMGLCRNEHEAQDLTQEALRIAGNKRDQVRDPRCLGRWLSTTLKRNLFMSRRHSQRFPECRLEDVEKHLVTDTSDREYQFDFEAVRGAMQQLDPVFRAPLQLFYFEDLSYKEIASDLDVPIGTVMSRLNRAKVLLRKTLEAPQNKEACVPMRCV